MNEKIAAVEAAIEAELLGAPVDYREADGMHTFVSTLAGAEKGVAFEDDAFETRSADDLLALLELHRVFDLFREETGPVYLLISGHGITRLHPLA